MATDHRGNPINDNNPAKTNAERMSEDITTGMTDAQMMDADMYFAEKSEYPDDERDEPDYEPPMIQRDEDGNRLDHSSMLPSQHQTGSGYGY